MPDVPLEAQRVTFIMKGSKEAVARLVRRMLDAAEFEHVAIRVEAATEEDLVEDEMYKRLREGQLT